MVLLEYAFQLSGRLLTMLPSALTESEHVDTVRELLEPYSELVEFQFYKLADRCNAYFQGFLPWEVAVVVCMISITTFLVLTWLRHLWLVIAEDGGLKASVFAAVRKLPPVVAYLNKEKYKLRESLLSSRAQHATRSAQHGVVANILHSLPIQGTSASDVISTMYNRAGGDVKLVDGRSKLSGAVYIGSADHRKLLDEAYCMFAISNPLHADVWPSVRQMEAEVIAMTASLLGGGVNGPAKEVCGAMTSGGTESILSAMKASRDYMKHTRGVRKPEMILARSAHAAYWKACEYFKIKPVVVDVGPDLRLSGAIVKRHLTRNTAIVVASAPGFPHGLVDHVKEIAQVTQRAGVCLHVDACLGGFVLPFARELGYKIPAFDFSVKGVTSMSVDTHKFGMAHKGTSVVLYANRDIRQYQFTGITDWTGGLYISPGMAGSRPGALIATAWASMIHMGREGFLAATRNLMETAHRFQEGVASQLPDLEVLGEPEMCVVAVRSKNHKALNIYKINDLLTKRGWHLNALQSPPAVHFCFTAAHTPKLVEGLLHDMAEAVTALKNNPNCISGGSAPMYGMANVVPDRAMIAEFLVCYQDVMLQP